MFVTNDALKINVTCDASLIDKANAIYLTYDVSTVDIKSTSRATKGELTMADLRNDLNGLRVQLPGRPEIYLIDEGCKRHIPNPATYDSLFRDWGGIVQDLDIDEIPNAAAISDGAVLAQGKGRAEVYLIDGGVKRHVPSPALMDRYHFRWPQSRLDTAVIDAIPTGRPIAAPR
ncbi:MAG: hypothetical protein ACRCT8_05500 [Lacipirellulaceae bacterium]